MKDINKKEIINFVDSLLKETIDKHTSKSAALNFVSVSELGKLRYKIYDGLHKMMKDEAINNDNTDFDSVNHPKHYCSHPSGVECIDIAKHYTFTIGNAIKYLWRAGLKKDADKSQKQKEVEDLQKAIWYINCRIDQLK